MAWCSRDRIVCITHRETSSRCVCVCVVSYLSIDEFHFKANWIFRGICKPNEKKKKSENIIHWRRDGWAGLFVVWFSTVVHADKYTKQTQNPHSYVDLLIPGFTKNLLVKLVWIKMSKKVWTGSIGCTTSVKGNAEIKSMRRWHGVFLYLMSLFCAEACAF